MIIKVDVPDEIAQAIAQGYGRERLATEFNLSDRKAGYYVQAISEGIRSNPFLKTALVLADFHCPYHDDAAVKVALDFGAIIKPNLVVILGDFVDFYQISSWSRDPKKRPFDEEVLQSRKLLEDISNRFSKSEKVFIKGNHEDRLRRYLWNRAPELEQLKRIGIKSLDIPDILNLQELGWEYIDTLDNLLNAEQTFTIGNLHLIHGHEVRISSGAVNLARLYYLKTFVNIMAAHHHQVQEYIVRRLDQSHEGGWTIGCLCNLSPEYAPVNNWVHGFGIVKYDPDGDFYVKAHKIINGKVL